MRIISFFILMLSSFSNLYAQINLKKIDTLIQEQQWQSILAHISNSKTTSSKCLMHYIKQKFYLETKVLVPKLWLVGHSQPKHCDRLFEFWLEEGVLNDVLILKRYTLALRSNQLALAKYLNGLLQDNSQAEYAQQYFKHPKRIIKHSSLANLDSSILLLAIERICVKTNAKEGEVLYDFLNQKYPFSEQDRIEIARILSIFHALDNNPKAQHWFDKIPAGDQTTKSLTWHARYLMKNHKWREVNDLVHKMPTELRNKPRWQYWLAYSEKKLGKLFSAQRRLQNIATEREFYGMLAALEIKAPLPFNEKETPIEHFNKETLKIILNPIKEQIDKDHFVTARQQWQGMIDELADPDRLIAAHIALEWEAPDLAIKMANSLEDTNHLRIRFPTHYEKPILKCAEIYQFDPALIFAIIRQESAYQKDAESQDGAIGLMQILHSTAKYIAKKQQLTYASKQMLKQPNRNIEFGCAYLSYLNKKFKGQILAAIAAYNMGPKNIEDNLPAHATDPILWIETLPRIETRHYLQNILTYTLIYQQRYHVKPSLLPYLEPIQKINDAI